MGEKLLIIILENSIIIIMLSIPFCFSLQMNLTYDGNGNQITGDGKYRVYNQFIRIYEENSSSGEMLKKYVHHPTENRVLIKKIILMDLMKQQFILMKYCLGIIPL